MKKITIPRSVTSIAEVFYGCSSLVEINVEEGNKNYSSENGILYNKVKTEIKCYPAGKTEISYTIPDGITRIGDNAFNRCENLTKVTITSTVTRIGDSTFLYCTNLKEVFIPSNVMRIGQDAFSNCYKILIQAEKGSYSDLYAQENNINRLTYTKMDWTNKPVDIELNGEKLHTFNTNGEYEFDYQYVDEVDCIEKEKRKVSVDWICGVGDINEDKKIDITDLLLLKRHIVSGNKATWKLADKKVVIADINKDGKVDVTDLLRSKRHIVSGNKEEWKIK